MNLKDVQGLSSKIVKDIDKKFNVERDVQLNLSQLLEELGELANVANLQRLRNKTPEKKALEDEFADVFLQLATLADSFDIDLEQSVLNKIEILKKRHGL